MLWTPRQATSKGETGCVRRGLPLASERKHDRLRLCGSERDHRRRDPRPRGAGLPRAAPHAIARCAERTPAPRELPARARAPRRAASARSSRATSRGQDHLALYLYNGNEYVEGDARRLQGARGAAQRQLPLRRGGAALPVPQLAARGRSSTTPSSRRTSPRSARELPELERAAPGGRRLRATRCCPARSTTRRRSRRASPASAAPSRRLARRPLHPLHRRHDRHAEGRALALGRHLRRGDGRPARRRPRARVARRDRPSTRGRGAAAALPDRAAAHARRRAVGPASSPWAWATP